MAENFLVSLLQVSEPQQAWFPNKFLFRFNHKEVVIQLTNCVFLVGVELKVQKIGNMAQKLVGYSEGKELCKGINPDEAIAYGAAVQAAMLSGYEIEKLQDFTLSDVIPLSLGVETTVMVLDTLDEHVMQVMIPRNTKVSIKMSSTFWTMFDNQVEAIFRNYEGESSSTLNNNFLGKITLEGIPPAPTGHA